MDLYSYRIDGCGPGVDGDIVIVGTAEGGDTDNDQVLGDGLHGDRTVSGLNICQGDQERPENTLPFRVRDKTDIVDGDRARAGNDRRDIFHCHVFQGDVAIGTDDQGDCLDKPAGAGRCFLVTTAETTGLDNCTCRSVQGHGAGTDMGIHQGYVSGVTTGLEDDLAVFAQGLEGAAQGQTLVVPVQVPGRVFGHGQMDGDATVAARALAGKNLDRAVRRVDDAGHDHVGARIEFDRVRCLDLARNQDRSSGSNADIGVTGQEAGILGDERRGLSYLHRPVSADHHAVGAPDGDHVVDHGIEGHLAAHRDIPFL